MKIWKTTEDMVGHVNENLQAPWNAEQRELPVTAVSGRNLSVTECPLGTEYNIRETAYTFMFYVHLVAAVLCGILNGE